MAGFSVFCGFVGVILWVLILVNVVGAFICCDLGVFDVGLGLLDWCGFGIICFLVLRFTFVGWVALV